MKMFERMNKDVTQWLKDIPTDRWSMSAFVIVCKNQAVTTNKCKQFNGTIFKYKAGEAFWGRTSFDPIRPPIIKKKPGKRKTKRKNAPKENANPHKMKRKFGPPNYSRCKRVRHRKNSCKANLGSSVVAIEEARPSHVPSDGDSAAAGDGVNDASAAA
ncbi:hypothetical protein CRG98_020937 [Punica granatum]|uniref:Uncharacterized protein n=1 Tax=Punica granatum TaxID=22663 RepID=A0A2I0JR07_PUNGR|nr:hypothetical protein CRG98_020937 [Punica granatum]